MTGQQTHNLEPLLEQVENAVLTYQDTQNFDMLAVACPLQDLATAFTSASVCDRATIEMATIKCLTGLQSAGLESARLFVLTRGLCHQLDKAAKNQADESVSNFSKALAEYGLGRFLHMAYAKASGIGEDPETFTFNELAAARIQATGSMGMAFTKKYADSKAAGKIALW